MIGAKKVRLDEERDLDQPHGVPGLFIPVYAPSRVAAGLDQLPSSTCALRMPPRKIVENIWEIAQYDSCRSLPVYCKSLGGDHEGTY